MSIYKKLSEARLRISKTEMKKSGHNTFAKFHYYELSDFLPHIVEINNTIGLISIIKFTPEYATLTIIDVDKPDDTIEFNSPMVSVDVKGANTIQNIGAMQTYQRRYLYITAYDICESDAVDSVKPSDVKTKDKPELKPNTPQWDGAVEYIKGNGTVAQIEQKYFLSAESKKLLLEAISA